MSEIYVTVDDEAYGPHEVHYDRRFDEPTKAQVEAELKRRENGGHDEQAKD